MFARRCWQLVIALGRKGDGGATKVANLPSIVTDYVVESVRWKMFSIRSVEEKSPHDVKVERSRWLSMRRKVWLFVVDDEKLLGARKVGGLVRLIKGKAEGGIGSWPWVEI